MKRVLWLLFILGILATGAFFLFQNSEEKKKGIVTADRGFTIEGMDAVDKIVIKHKKLQPMTFTKKGKSWILNDEFEVDYGVFVNIEKVLLNMRLAYIPPAAATKNILESISQNGIQVDLYDGNDQPFKIFHIGSDTQKGEGTYMVMAGSSQPYVMQLPGMSGGLRSRFEQPLKNYRDKFLYKFPANKIEIIKVEYPMDNFSSFYIEKKGKSFTITSLLDLVNKPKNPLNQSTLASYVAQFEMMGTEGLISEVPEIDSIISKVPICKLFLKLKAGKDIIHHFYSYDDIIEETGKISRTQEDLYQLNRVFIYTNDKDLYTAQNRVVRGLFLGYDDFFK